MYDILAKVVDFIHLIVIIFMVSGLIFFKSPRFIKVKIFHDYFCMMVLILQLICGCKCPLVILADNLRHLQNPEYEIKFTPFTEKIFMKLFGISISSNLVFIIIALLAVLGFAHLLTVITLKKIKRGT